MIYENSIAGQVDERALFNTWLSADTSFYLSTIDRLLAAFKAGRASLTPTAPADERQHHVEQVARMTKTNFALAGTVNDLATLARRLLHALNFADPGNGVAKVAANYLKRENLQGDPIRAEDVLRDSDTPTAPQAASQQANPPLKVFAYLDKIVKKEIADALASDYAHQSATTAACQPSTLTGQPDAAICQPAATTASASTIKTWQERCDITRKPEGQVEKAMAAEIADLRAALARAPLPAQDAKEKA